jgi:hypothetical protein
VGDGRSQRSRRHQGGVDGAAAVHDKDPSHDVFASDGRHEGVGFEAADDGDGAASAPDCIALTVRAVRGCWLPLLVLIRVWFRSSL